MPAAPIPSIPTPTLTPASTPTVTAPPPVPVPPSKPKEPAKPKATFNLQNIFKEKAEAPVERLIEEDNSQVPTKPLELEQVKKVWSDFAELRKSQIAEYSLLSRDFELQGNQIILPLSNPIEEPLLQGIRTSLIIYLRDKLSNSSINVTGVLKEVETKKMIYTNKDKFDYLAQKNPALKELAERFGLDPDF